MGTERALGKGGVHIELQPASKMKMPEMINISESIANEKSVASHDMSAMGRMKFGGGRVPVSSKIIVMLITLAMLAAGFAFAARNGDLSVHSGEMRKMAMPDMRMN